MDEVKNAFGKVKQDIFSLKDELGFLKDNLTQTKDQLIGVCDVLVKINEKTVKLENQNELIQDYLNKLNSTLEKRIDNSQTMIKKTTLDTSLDNQTGFPTESEVLRTDSTNFSTLQTYINPRKAKIQLISMGNEGVQTDRQTHKQTDIRQNNSSYNQKETNLQEDINSQDTNRDSIDLASNLLDSLSSIKKELRLKFKRLTDQELLVFSAIYQLEEEFGYSDYKSISHKLNLSESSIRDYVRRLIAKDIPLIKEKINNKEIHLSISPNLKRIATLNTILELRNI